MIACCLILAALLAIGAIIDVRSRRLPNWLTASVVFLYLPYVWFSPSPVDWQGALMVGGTCFVVGFALFAFNFMGGGDVKLISGVALWAGLDFIAMFLLVTGVTGGLLSIYSLLHRRLVHHPLILTFWPFLAVAIENRFGLALPQQKLIGAVGPSNSDPKEGSLPYGVAIAVGGFAVISALLKL